MRMGTYYRYQLLNSLGIFSNIKENDKILDIGGFDGYALSKLSPKIKILIDIDVDKKYKDIQYIQDDFLKHKFQNNCFDKIISFDVLEHIPKNTEKYYFRKIRKLLKKGGVAYITTPSKDIKTFPNFLRKWIGKKWNHQKCLGYTKSELKELMKNTGITDYEIYSYQSRYYLNYYLFIRFLQVILPIIIIKKLLLSIARKDAKLDDNISTGYYFMCLRK